MEGKMKAIFLDTETTGFDPIKNDVVQVAAIIEIDEKITQTVNLFCQPFSFESIAKESLEITGKTIKDLKAYPSPKEVYRELITLFSNLGIDKYNKKDKLIMIGQNPQFDYNFMREFFKKNGDDYWGSWVSNHTVDLKTAIALLRYRGIIPQLDNLKLETIAKYFEIEFKAHDAMEDIKVTRKIFRYIVDGWIIKKAKLANEDERG
jgi:DNA polymerase III epsilon subunit-like protein